MKKSYFTDHGFKRLCERGEIQPVLVRWLLDTGRYIPLRQEVGTTKVHKMVYLQPLDDFFTFVQDEETGGIVTTLYAGRVMKKEGKITRRISSALMKRAKVLALKKQEQLFNLKDIPAIRKDNPNYLITFGFQIVDNAGMSKTILKKVRVGDLKEEINLADDPILENLIEEVTRELSRGQVIELITVKFGRKKNSTPLHWFNPVFDLDLP